MRAWLRVWTIAVALAFSISVTCPFSLAQNKASSSRLVAELEDFSVNRFCTVSDAGTLLSGFSTTLSAPIDLAAYGYPTNGTVIPSGKLALQMDVYVAGDADLCALLQSGRASGQIEMSSSGKMDVAERAGEVSLIRWKTNEWARVQVDLSQLKFLSKGPFDPSCVNFFRVYINNLAAYAGRTVRLAITNVCVVDLTAPPTAEVPLGDGTFWPSDTEKTIVTPTAGFSHDVWVADYNLATYLEEHPEHATASDYAPAIQSIVDILGRQGGGTLFIPAGVYPCSRAIALPSGVRLCGEWKNPDEHPAVDGTVLAVCTAADDSTPFVTMARATAVQGITFWYPQQTVEHPVSYAPTVLVGDNTSLKNVTFLNAWQGVDSPTTLFGCADLKNVYGSPLSCGVEMDYIADLSRWDNLCFSPRYWAESGLEGAPTAERLGAYLYDNACAIRIRRVDWSYLNFVAVEGYRIGLHFAKGIKQDGGNSYPNGQCYDLRFEGCSTAVLVDALSPSGEAVAGLSVVDCTYGIRYENGSNQQLGSLKVLDADISATVALQLNEMAQVSLLSSVVREGRVVAASGWLSVMDTVFHTAAPHVELLQGALAAVCTRNVDVNGKTAVVYNPTACAIATEDTAVAVDELPTVSREDVLGTQRRPTSSAVTIASLDNMGKTDVTASLNALLQAQAETGGTVYLPVGHYRIDGTVTIPSGVQLLGENDFAHSSTLASIGTVLCLYNTQAVAIQLSADSGLRGVTLYQPLQNDQSDRFSAFPFAVQGQGADVYIVNVTCAGIYDGVDLMTYRCDRHYVEALRGCYLHTMLQVGSGAVDGVVYNGHLHQANIMYANYGWFDRPQGMTQEAWRDAVRAFTQRHMIVYRVGHVENELFFGNFSYSGYSGVALTAQESGAADITLAAHGVDYGTVGVDIEAAERVDIINPQMTAFNQLGDGFTEEMCNLRLGASVRGRVRLFGASIYESPQTMFDVAGGELWLYGVRYRSSSPSMVRMGENGALTVIDGFFGNYGIITQLPTAGANAENVRIYGGFYTQPLLNGDKLGALCGVLQAVTVPLHDTVFIAGTPATATQNGVADGYWCRDCERYVSGGETLYAMLWGDVNGNGVVNTTDARLTLQYVMGCDLPVKLSLACADVDNSGTVDSTDARLILQYTVRKIHTLPI